MKGDRHNLASSGKNGRWMAFTVGGFQGEVTFFWVLPANKRGGGAEERPHRWNRDSVVTWIHVCPTAGVVPA